MGKRVGKLIFCVIEKGEEDFSLHKKNQLALVGYRDIAAVVHEVDPQSWEKMSKEKLDGRLRWYQQVNVNLHSRYTMVPLRFGNIAPDPDHIKDFLARTYLHLKSALDKVMGKSEFVVQLSWDLKAVLQEMTQKWKGKLNSSTPVESGKALFEAAKEKRKVLVNTVHQRLLPLTVDFAEGKRTGNSMLMNRSYLIDKEKESLFDKAMEKLGRENQAYLTFRYVGPIPPYSFAPLEFNKGNFDLINEARKLLQLPQRSSFEAIKKSYRELSLEYHPDRNPDQPTAEEHFKRITQAYDILTTYCYSQGEASEYSFAKRGVEKTFIVK